MFGLFFSYLTLTLQFKLKHADEGSYLCMRTSSTKKELISCSDSTAAPEWQIEMKSDGSGLISPVGSSNVWDVAEAWRVEVKVRHGKTNQLFSLVYVSPDKYALVNRGKCLTFESLTHHMRVCNYSSNQLYTIVYNDTEANELTETKAVVGYSTQAVDYGRFDELRKMIEDNKELARNLASNHKSGFKRHHHHHHHHNKDGVFPSLFRQDTRPDLLSM